MDTNLGQVVLVKDIDSNIIESSGDSAPNSSAPRNLIEFDDKLYFSANDGENGEELFVSDGTAQGTQLLADIRPDSSDDGSNNSSYPDEFIEFNDRLYFAADDGESGIELFVSDGTAQGTQLLADIRPDSSDGGYNYNSFPKYFVEFDNQLYFSTKGNEFFVTDGTTEGTELVTDIDSGSEDISYFNVAYISQPIEFNNKLYFAAADDGLNNKELWVSDGTAEGTELLLEIEPGAEGSNPNEFVEFNEQLYFSANTEENGRELWVSDGTVEGTELLVDLNPNPDSSGFNGSYPDNLIVFDDKIYFTAFDSENGNELFVSDGTEEGTELLVDFNPGAEGSYASDFVEFNSKLYFAANNGENGNELFVSDGTADGTQLVADINPGTSDFGNSFGSNVSDLTVVGNELFFAANDGETGTELYKLLFEDAIAIDGSEDDDNLIGSEAVEQIEAFGGDDTIDGVGGNDTVDGGDGSDRIIGSSTGNDSLFGGNGNDIINSGNGTDTLNGGSGNDSLTSAGGNDSLNGGNGNDTLNGGMDADSLNGGRGQDLLRGNSGNDVLSGGGGFDTLEGNSGRDTLSGDSGNDTLIGGSGNDSLIGGNNNDYLDGSAGNDILEGGSGEDVFVLRTDAGTDTIMDFNLGSDRLGLTGGLEFDSLSFAGNNILSGGEILASLSGINTEQLTPSDFENV